MRWIIGVVFAGLAAAFFIQPAEAQNASCSVANTASARMICNDPGLREMNTAAHEWRARAGQTQQDYDYNARRRARCSDRECMEAALQTEMFELQAQINERAAAAAPAPLAPSPYPEQPAYPPTATENPQVYSTPQTTTAAPSPPPQYTEPAPAPAAEETPAQDEPSYNSPSGGQIALLLSIALILVIGAIAFFALRRGSQSNDAARSRGTPAYAPQPTTNYAPPPQSNYTPPPAAPPRPAPAPAAPQNLRGGGSGVLQTINLDSVAGWFAPIKWANVIILTFCIAMPFAFLATLLRGQPITINDLPSMLLFGLAGWVAWKNRGVLGAVTQPLTLTSLLWLTALGVLGLFLLIVALDSGAMTGDEASAGRAAFMNAFGILILGVVALGAAVALMLLRAARLDALNMKLSEFLRIARPPREGRDGRSWTPRNATLGWILLLLAAALMLGVQLIPDEIYFAASRSAQLFGYISQVAFLLFFWSRAQFEPRADTVLASDHRPPVLFLRSFLDDEKLNYQSMDQSLFDYSLESRLVEHFSGVGPFIAVGSPQEKMPSALGAARASLSDSEWQAQVLDWMDRSALIVTMVGTTPWVQWELGQVIARGHASKLIVLFPQLTKLNHFKDKTLRNRRRNAEVRLENVRAAFAGTQWDAALARIGDPLEVRSIVFQTDGGVVLTQTKARNRDAYHLAALTAHYALAQTHTQSTASWAPGREEPTHQPLGGAMPAAVASVLVAASFGVVMALPAPETPQGVADFAATAEPVPEPDPDIIDGYYNGRIVAALYDQYTFCYGYYAPSSCRTSERVIARSADQVRISRSQLFYFNYDAPQNFDQLLSGAILNRTALRPEGYEAREVQTLYVTREGLCRTPQGDEADAGSVEIEVIPNLSNPSTGRFTMSEATQYARTQALNAARNSVGQMLCSRYRPDASNPNVLYEEAFIDGVPQRGNASVIQLVDANSYVSLYVN